MWFTKWGFDCDGDIVIFVSFLWWQRSFTIYKDVVIRSNFNKIAEVGTKEHWARITTKSA